ncbi:hypothetical protein [Mesorhizobium sp.]|uniref:hypothetical protein n=1 Tax=Mesorhizobium sp. TaxID=1871066 RepID=UPI000FE82C4E|nr:hypothetical protein [Mesorhizobium sp.]RWP25161.1 MAG: hypothetical protein EOR03_33195 [Mesorhizobium sp.]
MVQKRANSEQGWTRHFQTTNAFIAFIAAILAVVGLSASQIYGLIFPSRAALQIGFEDTADFATLTMQVSNASDAPSIVGDELTCVDDDYYLVYRSAAPTAVPARDRTQMVFTNISIWAEKLAIEMMKQKPLSESEAKGFFEQLGVPDEFSCSIASSDDTGQLLSTKFPRNQIRLYVRDGVRSPKVQAHFTGPQ